ncbi:MAG TPA: VWA domain-containing protein [Blastocatellia bacterium]|nr:VWA domain-containing protein [Blastocatellia bacterium]
MRKKVFTGLAILTLFACISSIPTAIIRAQDDKKPKQEKFGSSLKRYDQTKPNPKDKNAKKGADTKKITPKAGDGLDDELSLQSTLAVFDVMVTDNKQHFVPGLTKDDFVVYEDGVEQQVGTCAIGEDVILPRSIALIIDYSGSQYPFIKASVEAAEVLVNNLTPKDEMAIITDDVDILQDYTNDKGALIKALEGLKKKAKDGKEGLSLQMSALLATLQEKVKVSDDKRSIIIFQTDGDEIFKLRDQKDLFKKYYPYLEQTTEKFGFSDVKNKVENTRATIYAVVPGDQLINVPDDEALRRTKVMLDQVAVADGWDPAKITRYQKDIQQSLGFWRSGQTAVATIASLSGGWTGFLSKPEEASAIYNKILTDINHRYIIGYYPKDTTADGRLRKLKFEVRGHPEYKVHGRDSYSISKPDDK